MPVKNKIIFFYRLSKRSDNNSLLPKSLFEFTSFRLKMSPPGFFQREDRIKNYELLNFLKCTYN